MGVAGMVTGRETDAPVGWAVEADDSRLIAELDAVVHMAESRLRIRGAAARDRAAAQVEIKDEAAALTHGQHDLPIDEGPTHLAEDGLNPLHIRAGQCAQGAAHAAVVGPAGLAPGVCNNCIFVQRMGGLAQVFQIR